MKTSIAQGVPTVTGASAGAMSRQRAARIAGWGYVAIFFLAIFANFVVVEGMVVADDAGATAANIAGSEGLFRLGLVAFLAVFVIDVIVAWALYVVFRETNRDLSLVAAWFRLVYTVFLGVALIFFFQALQYVGAAGGLGASGEDQLHAQVMVALDSFDATWLIGLVAFGLHLIVIGRLILVSRIAPKALGYLLMVAGVAYIVDTVAHALLGTYADYETVFLVVVAVPSVIAEGWFGLWLLLRVGRPSGARPRTAVA